MAESSSASASERHGRRVRDPPLSGYARCLVVTQLSVLFGVPFVISGENLWTVVLCHGLYDTVAFIRFANRSSKYSNLDDCQQGLGS